MGLLSRILSWLGASPPTTSFTIDGVGVEKISVYAQGREATLEEMLRVIQGPSFRIEGGGEGSSMKSSTEEWNAGPGESDEAVVERVAQEVAAHHPGRAVVAFDWPDAHPMIIAVYVTEGPFLSPRFLRTRYRFEVPAAAP